MVDPSSPNGRPHLLSNSKRDRSRGNASEALSQLGTAEAQALADEAMNLIMDELFTLEREEDGEYELPLQVGAEPLLIRRLHHVQSANRPARSNAADPGESPAAPGAQCWRA